MDDTLTLFEVSEDHGAKWLKVFEHNSTNETYFKNETEALYSLKKEKFSILKYLSRVNRFDSRYYEFFIEYPELAGFNRWRQRVNPLSVRSKTDVGFEPVELTWEGYVISGLALSNFDTATFIDGCSNNTGIWWYSIGAYKSDENSDTFPGPRIWDENGNGIYYFYARRVKLWIRVKELEHLINYICTCYNTKISNYKVLYILFIEIYK
jgi:hypothetical protein